jgi:hypothetical protein
MVAADPIAVLARLPCEFGRLDFVVFVGPPPASSGPSNQSNPSKSPLKFEKCMDFIFGVSVNDMDVIGA